MSDVGKVLSSLDVKRDSGVPLAQEAGRALAQAIRAGDIPAGRKLPATEKLAELLGISQQIAQHALASLADQNLVRRKPGLGTVVLEPRDVPVVGLLSVVGGAVSLTADVGWVIANDFLNVMNRRGMEHREYIRHRDSNEGQKLPPNLVDDLLNDNIDVLMVGGIYEEIVQECVPASEVPTLHLSPRQTESMSVIEDAVRWLWRQDCRRVGAVMEQVEEAREVAQVFKQQCAHFDIEVPPEWCKMDCVSSIQRGCELFQEFYEDGDQEPDGLLIMDDMVACGLFREAQKRKYDLDQTHVVAMVNRGSNLYIPPSCPRIVLDWEAVIERELDRWLRSSKRTGGVVKGREAIYRFTPCATEQAGASVAPTSESSPAEQPPACERA